VVDKRHHGSDDFHAIGRAGRIIVVENVAIEPGGYFWRWITGN
jgi:hypothetical protein